MKPLEPMLTAARIARLRESFDESGLDAVVVSNLANIRYLTGFTGTAGVLVVAPSQARLITDGRYDEQAHDQIAASGAPVSIVVTTNELKERTIDAVGGARRVGLEAASVSWAQMTTYQGWFEAAELVPTEGLVEALRSVKDPGEIARIAHAADIADEALAARRPTLLEGPTEREFALELEAEMRRRGATGPAFETIVASGPNAARPHYRPGDRAIRPGDLVVIDFGAIVDGYRSDMTRTVMVADVTPEQEQLFELVVAAQAAGVAAVGPDVEAKAVDAACREVIVAAGFGERFVHGTGHGVGLDIHEAPWVNSRTNATLQPGNVVTVEPGVYVPGLGGVRIEDTLVVTDVGHRALTHTSKTPAVA